MAAVDVVLGPLLTLVIYNRAKARRELLLDYTVIATLQACAFSFGVWTVFSGRTAVVVFTDGTFYTIGADEAASLSAPYPALLYAARGRPAYAMVNMPAAAEARQALRRESQAEQRPLFQFLNLVGPFTPDKVAGIADYGIDPDDLIATRPQARHKLDRFLAHHGGPLSRYLFLPVRPRYQPIILAFDRTTGELVDWLDLAPPNRVVVKTHSAATAHTTSGS